jgi:hypothetical protein
MKFRFVFWDVLPCKIIVDRRFRGTCYLHHKMDQVLTVASMKFKFVFWDVLPYKIIVD